MRKMKINSMKNEYDPKVITFDKVCFLYANFEVVLIDLNDINFQILE